MYSTFPLTYAWPSLFLAEYPDQHHDEEAINSALHRLAIRQQQRQYTANKGSNILANPPEGDLGEAGDQGSLSLRHRTHSLGSVNIQDLSAARTSMPTTSIQTNVDNFDIVHSTDSPPAVHEAAVRENGDMRKSRSSSASRSTRTANDTFDSFVQDTYGYGNELVTAYNTVTGVNPLNNSYTPSPGSSQYQYAQQQQHMKQQRMIEQSKALLEQSRIKHQQMIAQAHAATKSRKEPASGSQVYSPKPPPKPPSDKKSTSAHRLAR